MIPSTYHDNESSVRVCDCCHFLTERFADALRSGNLDRAQAIFSTGNINLRNPYTIYVTHEYPIHAACQGGNLTLLRWLLEDRFCTIYDSTQEPLKTTAGLTAFSIAAKFGHRDIMRYLVHYHGSSVMEIVDMNILLKGLHSSLEVRV